MCRMSDVLLWGPISSQNHVITAHLYFGESDPETVSLAFNGQDEGVLVAIVLNYVVVHVDQDTNG